VPLVELDSALSSPSYKAPRLKRALRVTTLSDVSWLGPIIWEVLPQIDVKVDLSVFHPLMAKLPQVRPTGCGAVG
jgi:hypothetical protein